MSLWKELIVSDNFQEDLMLLMASTCQDERAGQKVRSEACRSLGEVTTNLIPVIGAAGDISIQLVHKICQQLVACLDDPSDNVVSMAVFGLGNLAQVLSSADLNILPDESRYLLSISVIARMNSDDPKTASNAIRAAAWTICMLEHHRKQGDEDFFHDTLEKCLERIAIRIEQVQALEKGDLSHFSWKQRSAVKKLGCGACNALTIIFSNVEASSNVGANYPRVVTCIQLLFLCIEDLPSANEKLVSTAMGALRSIEARTLCRVMENKACMIKAIDTLMQHLCTFAGNRKESKLHSDMGTTLVHLLDSSTIKDLHHVLEHCQTRDDVGDLYQWGKEQALPTDVWGKLALAAHQCTSLDVYWEQRFVNEAHQLLLQSELLDEL
jgi:hypothetical protein